MKRIWLAGAVALAMAGAAQADEWGTTLDLAMGGTAIDVTSIQKVGNTVTYWNMDIPTEAVFLKDKRVAYGLIKYEMNCFRHTYRPLTSVAYDESGANLNTVKENPGAPADDIIPDSLGAKVEPIVCAGDRTGFYPASSDVSDVYRRLKKVVDGLHANDNPRKK